MDEREVVDRAAQFRAMRNVSHLSGDKVLARCCSHAAYATLMSAPRFVELQRCTYGEPFDFAISDCDRDHVLETTRKMIKQVSAVPQEFIDLLVSVYELCGGAEPLRRELAQ